jgi:hypothetical protein
MNLTIEKVFSSSTLPRTMIMAVSTSFKNLDNFSTIMAFEIKHPHNLVVGLHLNSMDVGQP